LAFKCKQPAFYANDIRKNWHSGRLKLGEGKFKLQIFPHWRTLKEQKSFQAEMEKIFHSSA
jgi:hypothetical protein